MSEVFDIDEVRQSQIPAAHLLSNLGFKVLSRADAEARRGRLSRVLLEDVLVEKVLELNTFSWKGETLRFNDGDAEEAVRRLRPDPARIRGLSGTNQDIYDALMLGATIEKTIDGDRKSFSVRYIDWENPERNAYHATLEMAVERTGSLETRRCDIVLFVNGVPFVVIECKNPNKDVNDAVSQIIGYQNTDNIPHLFHFVQMVLGVNRKEARYATVATGKKFWSFWREQEDSDEDVAAAVNAPISATDKSALFAGEFAQYRKYFDDLEVHGPRQPTEQDKTLYALCRPERLLDLVRTYTVFDGGVRKLARYQQFFAVRETLKRIKKKDNEGRRQGGVIWHTQGSGKSLTMVMLGKALAFDKAEIKKPRIVIVTDRDDLDRQIKATFKACEMEPIRATSGRNLLAALKGGASLVTAIINKFESAAKYADETIDDRDIFVMVDESHRTNYGSFAAQMRRLLPLACYIGFTGTPLLKNEKSTLNRFGGLIHKYSIDQAVKDKAVVPLLYEGRFVDQHISGPSIDDWFDKLSEGLTELQKADLRKMFARMKPLSQTDQIIYAQALDISEHYRQLWQDTGFKAQLVAPSKAAAVRFKEILDEIGHVSSEVVISAPDDREGNEEVDEPSKLKVRRFWDAMMKRFGGEVPYNRQIIDDFKGPDAPEILIVVSKLLTGFDAPRNTVLYLCSSLREHNLLQAIARVNRLFEDEGKEKEFGYIIDYQGLLGELDRALNTYSELSGYEAEDVKDVVQSVRNEIELLSILHGNLWDLFQELPNKKDMEAFEQFLGDDAVRHDFYERLTKFGSCLRTCLGSEKTRDVYSEAEMMKFGQDWKRFDALRKSVRIRYQETVDYKEFEPKIRALLDKHVIAAPAVVLIDPVDITDSKGLQTVIGETSVSEASRADRIARATKKTITERLEEDPALYKSFYEMLEKTIEDYKARRLSEKEYLEKVFGIAKDVAGGARQTHVPSEIEGDEDAKSFYPLVLQHLFDNPSEAGKGHAAHIAKRMADIIRGRLIVNFWKNDQAQKAMLNDIDDFFFDEAPTDGMNSSTKALDALIQELLRVAKARFKV